MNIWYVLLILLGVSLLFSAVGFKKFVWFLSIGYGMSICACGIAIAIIYACLGKLDLIGLIACLVLTAYGFRLGGFLLIRQLKNANYKKTLETVTKDEKKIPVFVSIFVWLIVAVLYVAEVSGVVFAIEYATPSIGSGFFATNWFEIAGVVVMIFGAVIEAVADAQKSKYKKVDPHKPAMQGLYKLQRCPNYFGEIMFWTGVVVYFCATCLPYVAEWWMFVIVLLAWLSIVYVMLNGAKRLENRQLKNYGEMEDFQEYIKKTPIIIVVFIPIHSLIKSKLIK